MYYNIKAAENQCGALYIINSAGIAYHQNEVLYIIKPTEMHTWRCDEIQRRCAAFDDIQPNGWWYAKPVGLDKKRTKHSLRSFLELIPRFELGTSSLPRMRSTGWAISARKRDNGYIIHPWKEKCKRKNEKIKIFLPAAEERRRKKAGKHPAGSPCPWAHQQWEGGIHRPSLSAVFSGYLPI